MSKPGWITASILTDQGLVRTHNEDFVASIEPEEFEDALRNGFLYIVADGVGGSEAGEIASRFATEQTIHHYRNDRSNRDWGKRLVNAMLAANDDLRRLISESESKRRMATTMVAAVCHPSGAVIANVGDSRGYLLRDGKLEQVTKDHSLVARLVEEGAITEEEAINHPRKNVILHSLGSESHPPVDLYTLELRAGEQIVLCSDGLTRHVSDAEIAAAAGDGDPDQAAAALVHLARERGGEDNISVAVLKFGELPSGYALEFSDTVEKSSAKQTGLADPRIRRALWFYSAILCLVQTMLMILIWNLTSG